MKRRDLLKGLTFVTGGALCSKPSWTLPIGSWEGQPSTPAVVPIRALARIHGELRQPIQITAPAATKDTTVITKINGTEVDRRSLGEGAQSFLVFTAPVSSPRNVHVTVECNGQTIAADVTLKPVRKVLVYILPHSHHDLGYTDLQANVEEKQMHNITLGIEAASRTANYPEGARFIWNLEVLWGADLFLHRRSQEEKAAFLDALRKGWLSPNGMYANELTGLCRPEELLQLFRYGIELGKQCDIKVDSAMLSDVPGFTWGTVTAMSQAGIRYFSAAPNYFDRIGTFMVDWQDKPFWWISPSGRERVLVWVPWTGYAMSHIVHKLSVEWADKYQDRLDEVNYPYDISHIRWSGHGDNAEPDPAICEFVKSWNQDYEWPKFHISSTSTAFSAFEQRYGNQLPEKKGDLTPYWEDGAGSSALETRMNRLAADRLTQAEALTAMLSPGLYSPEKYREAWRNVLLYSEHTWGAWCSVSDSENPFTKKQWEVKRDFAVNAEKNSYELLNQVLSNSTTPGNTDVVEVHNTTSWPRSEVVFLAKELSTAGDRVTDDRRTPLASQRLSTGELAVFVHNVPAFGSIRLHLSRGKAHAPASPVSIKDGVLSNGLVHAKVNAGTGNLVELKRHGSFSNLIDLSSGEEANEYLFLEGKDLKNLQRSGTATVTVEEQGPLVASLRVNSQAPGCNSLVRKIRLIAGMDHIELVNIVDKKRAPLNPHPGKGGPGDEFAQHEAKESVQFAFPFAVEQGQIRMDIPLAVMRPETDQLPGSCKNWLPVGRWIDVANAQHGVTWVTLDAPLVEIGEISATMLGSQKNPEIWRKHIEPRQKFYSWVMNNHWGTNYRAYQEGVVEFRYALRPHEGYDPAAASRLAIGLTQPLLLSSVRSTSSAPPLLQIQPEDVLITTLKPSEDGKAWIICLFGASGEERHVRLKWPSSKPSHLWMSDLSEAPLRPIKEGDEIPVAGWDLVTIRADRA